MKKQHRIWLEAFMQNCKEGNKSDHTLINYRSDLLKYIRWFESTQHGPLNKANSSTITRYQNFLSKNENETAVNAKKDKKKGKIKNKSKDSGKWNLIKTVFGFFKKSFTKNENVNVNKNENEEEIKKESKNEHLKLSVNSRRRNLSAIKNFYEFLKQSNEDINNLFPTNPVKSKLHNIRLKDEDILPTKLLTPDDWKQLDDNIYRPKERLIIYILYYGGLRLSELSELKVEYFNQSNQSLRFNRKGGYIHTLYIQRPKQVFSLLEKYLRSRPIESPFLFCNKRGRPLTSRAMYNTIIKIFTKAKVHSYGLTPHSFRKGCASLLYQKTKDLLLVRDYLNHADAKVTQTYIERLDRSENKLELEKLEGG
ncbi:MAG: site-specific integrase [Oligoflexia bacterium]|nr:site-specific integrase [Oligoflexia bacterium]